jgi:aspartyl-tRNA(Asn)/glutamyl-tRNA(Gln) amidotransferase subunit A
VRFDELELCYALGDTISKVEAAALHGEAMRERPSDFSQAVYSRTEPGLHLPAVRYVEALNLRAKLLQAFLDGPLGAADALVCPTLPVPVPLAVDADMEQPGRVFDVVPRLTMLTRPFSYLGVPVLSMPVGLDDAGMPIGVQLVGRPFSEARLLAISNALAAALDWPALSRRRRYAAS